MKDNVCIESHSKDFLTKLQNKNLDYKLFIHPTSFEAGLQIAIDRNLYGIVISATIITKEQVQLSHQHGIRVALYNTYSQSKNIEAIKKNSDII